jgi:hypothetical protein
MQDLLTRTENYVRGQMDRSGGAETTVGQVANALGITTDVVLFVRHMSTPLCILSPGDGPVEEWSIFLEVPIVGPEVPSFNDRVRKRALDRFLPDHLTPPPASDLAQGAPDGADNLPG